MLLTESDAVRKKLTWGLVAICAALAVFDLLYHRHGKFEIETLPAFYGIFGFLAFAFIIFATKVLKKLLGRPEDYYGEGAVDSEDYPARKLGLKEFGDE